MPRGTRKADAAAAPASETKLDPTAKQKAIVKRAEAALDKAAIGQRAAADKLDEANRKVKLAVRELDYQRSHPDLEDVPETISVPEAIPDVKPHVEDIVTTSDPMADDSPPWPGDAPPKDPLA